MRYTAFLNLALVSVLTLACTRLDREELELLKKDDSEFNNVVTVKSEADREIGGLRAELASTKAVYDKRKSELQASYDQEAARLGGQITVLKTKIEGLRDRYRGEVRELSGACDAKKAQLRELQAALRELDDVLAKKGTLDLSSNESQSWEGRRESLEDRIGALGADIAKFESEIALKRKKLKYL